MEQYSVYLTGRALWNCASASPENPEHIADLKKAKNEMMLPAFLDPLTGHAT